MPRAVACNSGTSGLHLAMLMAGVGRGDEVLAPALTFIAAVNPIRYAGAWSRVHRLRREPVPVPGAGRGVACRQHRTAGRQMREQAHGRARESASGGACVRQYGQYAGLVELCRKYGLVLIEDSTEALGTYYTEGPYRGKMAGTIGEIRRVQLQRQ